MTVARGTICSTAYCCCVEGDKKVMLDASVYDTEQQRQKLKQNNNVAETITHKL